MKLEAGMWVRTKDGEIFKCLNVIIDNNNPKLNRFMNEWGNMIMFDEISKASHNIIDLIEVGDYVNGFPVIHKENDILKCGLLVQFKENEIKSIVTKEQFESMSYKVGD